MLDSLIIARQLDNGESDKLRQKNPALRRALLS